MRFEPDGMAASHLLFVPDFRAGMNGMIHAEV
jgi:hypothetical protein